MVTVKFFEYGKLYNTIDASMSNDLLLKFDANQLESYVSKIKLIRYVDDEEHIDIQISVIERTDDWMDKLNDLLNEYKLITQDKHPL